MCRSPLARRAAADAAVGDVKALHGLCGRSPHHRAMEQSPSSDSPAGYPSNGHFRSSRGRTAADGPTPWTGARSMSHATTPSRLPKALPCGAGGLHVGRERGGRRAAVRNARSRPDLQMPAAPSYTIAAGADRSPVTRRLTSVAMGGPIARPSGGCGARGSCPVLRDRRGSSRHRLDHGGSPARGQAITSDTRGRFRCKTPRRKPPLQTRLPAPSADDVSARSTGTVPSPSGSAQAPPGSRSARCSAGSPDGHAAGAWPGPAAAPRRRHGRSDRP